MIELWPIWAVRLSEQTNIGLGVQKSNRKKKLKKSTRFSISVTSFFEFPSAYSFYGVKFTL